MNVLFLAPQFPLPADTGGKIRTFNILKQLSKYHKVHLLCFSFSAKDRDLLHLVEDLGVRATLVPLRDSSVITKSLKILLSPLPVSISKYRSARMRKAMDDLLKDQQFDAIHVDHLHMAYYGAFYQDMLCFMDEHNVEYKILDRCAKVEKSPVKRWVYMNQTRKMKRFESASIGFFDGVFACSFDDQLDLSHLNAGLTPVHVVPNGVDTAYFDMPVNAQTAHETLVFTGSMDWLPNDDGITYFCTEILPVIWSTKPAVKIVVVGKSPSSAVKSLAAKDKRVIVTGRVEDVRPYIQQSGIFIVPLRIGGGTRIKILEAMAARKAVVSTSIGAEGIRYKDGVNIAIADTPQTFARKIIELCEDPARVHAMGQAARECVCRQYDWDNIGTALNGFYEEAKHGAK